MEGLNPFQKIEIAACAVRRARLYVHDQKRFSREYETAMLWKGHRVTQYGETGGQPYGFVSKA